MWDPRAVIVVILAVAIAVGHVISIIGVVQSGRPIGEAGGDVLIALVGAIIAIIAGYVASFAPARTKPQEEQPPSEPGDGRDQHLP